MNLRDTSRGLAVFTASFGAGIAAWPWVADSFCSGFVHLCDWLIASHAFGPVARAEFIALPSSPENWAWNEAVGLLARFSVPLRDELQWETQIVLYPWRPVYLPLVFFSALLAAAPISAGRRAACLLYGLPIMLGLAVGSVWLTLSTFISRWPLAAYSAEAVRALELAYGALVEPLGVKFAIPLLLASCLALGQGRALARISHSASKHDARVPRNRPSAGPALRAP